MSHMYLAFKEGPLFQRMGLDQVLPHAFNPIGTLHVELLYKLVDDMSHRDSRNSACWRFVGIPVRDKQRLLEFMRSLVGCQFNMDSLFQLVSGWRLPFQQRGASREFVRMPDRRKDKFFCAEGLTLALFDQQYRSEFNADPCDMTPGEMYKMAMRVPGALELLSHPAIPHQTF